MKILIAGCGYLGTALGIELARAGHTVWGLRRKADKPPAPIHALTVDLLQPQLLKKIPDPLDIACFMLSPQDHDEAAYRSTYQDALMNLLDCLKKRRPLKRFIFVSSTSVYGQQNGEWVNENSETHPEHFSGQIMLRSEELVFESGLASTVLRLGGIYGPGRSTLLEHVRSGKAVLRGGPPVYVNRIHRDDAVGILTHVLKLKNPKPVYLGVDHDPAELNTVLTWLADKLNVTLAQSAASDPHSRTRQSNKRCMNALILQSGYTFKHPTFREGYAQT